MDQTRELYLDLMKRCLLNLIYLDNEIINETFIPKNFFQKKIIDRFFTSRGLRVVRPGGPPNAENRVEGKDWPAWAHTMIGLKRLDNIQFCLEDIIKNNIPGDYIEAGVWRGGGLFLQEQFLRRMT